MIIVSGTITLKPGRRNEFLAASREAMVQARRVRGCRRFVVAADPIEPDAVHICEEWDGEADLAAFRGAGMGADMRELIQSADVGRHEIARSGPA